jgi:hypothetical protein
MMLTLREGVPLRVKSSAPLVCPSSVETGEGRPLARDELALTVGWSSSGSTASLLGCGVNCVRLVDAANLSFNAGFRGELRSGSLVVELGVGVLLKNPWSVRCPPPELDFFNDAGAGVDEAAFLAIFENDTDNYRRFFATSI